MLDHIRHTPLDCSGKLTVRIMVRSDVILCGISSAICPVWWSDDVIKYLCAASSVVPWYMSYSPSDLLDRRLDVSCRLRAAQIDNSAAAQPLSTAAVQPQASTSVDVLHHELSLLHAELMFERQRRDVHARRGRRLLARISQLNSLADQNEAVVRDIVLHGRVKKTLGFLKNPTR